MKINDKSRRIFFKWIINMGTSCVDKLNLVQVDTNNLMILQIEPCTVEPGKIDTKQFDDTN